MDGAWRPPRRLKAWGWRRKIEREGVTITDIASAENKTPRYVRRLLQLAWLAPDLMETILDGIQPPELTLERFRNNQPAAWQAQQAAFGYNIRQSMPRHSALLPRLGS